MNRTGLFIVLGIALFAGLLFAIFPQLDLALARLFYDAASQRFTVRTYWLAEYTRRCAMWIAWALAAPAIITPIVKLFQPRKPLLIPGRAVIFLLSTIFLTAIVLPNLIFKEYWGRPRPVATREFQGLHEFKAWWDPRGANPHNGSFFSGEAATAFWTLAPAALAPPQFRPVAYAGAVIFGLTTGILRMAFGGHYASDVIAAGVAAFLVVWLMHGLIYRWKNTRLNDQRIDDALGQMILRFRSEKYFWALILILAALTAIRIFALRFSVVDLFPDEARYWSWAQTPAFGYYSKPPLIAWIIAAAGYICGSSEACVRAPAPLFYAGTALITYLITRDLYGERAAFWAGLSIALATGAVFSARIISTDVPLLFFWALAVLAYIKLLDAASWRWALILGLALGLGLLAKYAMVYFLLGVVALSWIDPRARAIWRERAIWFALLLAFLIVLPNLIWNASHDFATFRHTRGNIVGAGVRLNPLDALAFVGGQFAVCGPIIFAVFVIALVRPSWFRLERADRIMIAFALPPLVLVALVAFVTSAKANWAAPAAISMTIMAAALLVRLKQLRWLQVSVAIGVILQIVLFVADGYADRISLSVLAQPDIYHRTMGWKSMSNLVRQTAAASGARTIVAEQNAVVASLTYYLRADKWPILAWPSAPTAANQFEFDRPLTGGAAEPILFLSDRSAADMLVKIYTSVERLPPIDAATGPHSSRRLFAFKVSGIRNLAPVTATTR